MSLSSVATGDIILAAHHNSLVELLTGVMTDQAITLARNSAGVITLTPTSDPAAATELIILNNAAGTRQFAVTAGGDLVGTGGILTLPAGADTLVGRATTDTLTNKTLTAPTIADFTNAAHDHGDADDGGTLAAGAVTSFKDLLDWQFARKTATTTTDTDTTLSDDPHLVIAIGASETWLFDCVLFVDAGNATMDLKVAFTVPASATLRWGGHGQNANATDNETGDLNVISIAASGTSARYGSQTDDTTILIKGIVVNSTNAGNITLQTAQNTSDAGTLSILANSYIIARRVA